MGLITGRYDAKPDGFSPGGCSIHNAYTAHGPDSNAYEKAIAETLKPVRYKHTLAFMFESQAIWQPSKAAMDCEVATNKLY